MRALKKVFPEALDLIKEALASLQEIYNQPGKGLQLIEVAGGWQITTRPEYHERVGRLFRQPASVATFDPGARDTGGDRLPSAGDRPPRSWSSEAYALRVSCAPFSNENWSRSWAARKSWAIPSCTARPKNSLCPGFGLKDVKDLPQLKDMSEVFGDEVAQQLETLEKLDEVKEQAEIEPLPGPRDSPR